MRILNVVLAAAAVTFTLASTAPDASARGFHGGFHHSHWSHSHWGHHFHRWGYRSHFGYRYGFHRHYRWGYRVGYRTVADAAPRACPPGFHLGYLGRFCHPNRY